MDSEETTPASPPSRSPTDHEPAHAPAPTARSLSAWLILGATLALGLATDLVSKWAAFRYLASTPAVIDRADVIATDRLSVLLPAHEPVSAVPVLLDLTLVLNPGAVFGIGSGQRWLFVAFTAFAVLFAMWVFLKWTTARDRLAHFAIGLLLAGGLGNLYDRLSFACVRDFLHPLPGMKLPLSIKWPNGSDEVWPYVSNIADLWLIIGIGLLLVLCWRAPGGADQGPGADSTDAGSPDS